MTLHENEVLGSFTMYCHNRQFAHYVHVSNSVVQTQISERCVLVMRTGPTGAKLIGRPIVNSRMLLGLAG